MFLSGELLFQFCSVGIFSIHTIPRFGQGLFTFHLLFESTELCEGRLAAGPFQGRVDLLT